MLKSNVLSLVLLFLTLAVANVSFAVKPVSTGFFSDLALQGYDPVSYFSEGVPLKGEKAFEYEWKGATWRFASEENLDLFVVNPEAYAPQYGGYCAYAVALGETATVDPFKYSIVDGKLYLNFNAKTKVLWLENRDQFIEDADNNWPVLLGESAP